MDPESGNSNPSPITSSLPKPRKGSHSGSSARGPTWGIWVLFAFYSLIVLGVGIILGSIVKPSTGKRPPILRRSPFYSPITPISDNRRIPPAPNMIYFGPPTKENNDAWENICGEDDGIVGISDKRVLRNLPRSLKGGKEGEYVYGIGVCRQLHCLNHIRLALYDRSTSEPGTRLDNCIEFLREVLTCKADIAMHYWKKANESEWDVVHQCWDFNKVVEWAREHRITRLPGVSG
ncbi:hypothetical protein HOY82DRAFT_598591 [Tuber indicum]|nr:hypothetical protein HOY82DRAFT_598591 [Tuber indicum]